MSLTSFPSGIKTDNDGFVLIRIASSSAVTTTYSPVPFAGTVESVVFVQEAALPAVPGTITVKVGSAGETVGTITLTSAGVAGAVQSGTGEASVAVAVTDSLSAARVVSGTAFSGIVGVTLKRTA
jgi:hypothetical protein